MVKLAVTASSFAQPLQRGELDMPAVIRGVQRLGIRRIELMDPLIRPGALPDIQRALAQHGVGVAGYLLFCGATALEPRPPVRGT
jgi:hypothetical protein